MSHKAAESAGKRKPFLDQHGYEFRPDCGVQQKPCGMGPSLDEVVALDAPAIHFERMDKHVYWCGVELKNGKRLRIIIQSARAPIHMWAEVE